MSMSERCRVEWVGSMKEVSKCKVGDCSVVTSSLSLIYLYLMRIKFWEKLIVTN